MKIQYNLFPKILEGNDLDNTKKEECWDKKDKIFGLQYCSDAFFSGKYGIPMSDNYSLSVPEHFITFGDINKTDDYACGVTFFDDDKRLESIWKSPSRYLARLQKFHCVTEPDFSLKIGEPLSVQIANCYRNHAIAYFLQSNGINIIPTMSWSTNESYEFCFDGYSKHGVVIVSSIGTLRDERSRLYFKNGFFEMLRRIEPDTVILYGDVNDDLKSWLPSQLDVRFTDHKRFKRARRYGK